MIHVTTEYDDDNGISVADDPQYAIDRMPLYGIERVAGLDDTLPNVGTLTPFRMKDGDGLLSYEGVLTNDDEGINQSAALRWGETMAGCTTIEVKIGNTWVMEIG
ncbi:MAG: hypothetical protein H0U53_10965 [Actinobacteria bacterium]|nr:hypothetical protein [Actinomycetota bacterium]